MQRVVVGLAIVIASGCAGDDGSNPADGGADTEGSTGGDILANPDGTSGDTTDETGMVDSGGFGWPDDSDGGSSGDGPAASFSEGFERALVGQPPGAPWLDVTTRIDEPTVSSPTATVIDTIGVDGDPTRALHLHDAIGTSQGILASVEPSTRHRVSASVRVEQFSDAVGNTWPVAVGLTQDTHEGDLHASPRAIVYAHPDGHWHMSIADGTEPEPGVDRVVPTPAIELDRWYRVMLEVDRQTGSFRAEIRDAGTDEPLGEHVVYPFDWEPEAGDYDTIAFFDGEYDVMGGTLGGEASVDDIEYAPVYWGG